MLKLWLQKSQQPTKTNDHTPIPHPFPPPTDPEDAPLEVVLTMTRKQWQRTLWTLDDTTDVVSAEAKEILASELARHGIKP